MPAPQLIVATSNPGKIAELVALLGDRFEVLPRPSELAETIEDGDTLEANATKKAVEVANHANALALADDTGLFADALDGRPGVHTARFAGEEATDAENVAKLLAALEGSSDRRARFRTVIAVADTEGNVKLSTGTVEGSIATEIRGADGFGYDPVFIPDEADGRTFAEMTKAEKNQISHRARALQAMLTELRT